MAAERHGRRRSLQHAARAAAALVGGGLALAACSSAPSSPGVGAVLTAASGSRSVQLNLVAAATGANSGFNFDGYGSGAMTVSVPVGWRVVVTCENASAVFTHSCAIVRDVAPGVNGAPLAFAGAEIPNAHSGLQHGDSATFQFVAAQTGRYKIACLVTGHELDGMWDWFVVSAGGRPQVSYAKR